MDNAITNIFDLRAIIEAIETGSTLNKIYLQKEFECSVFYELNKLIKEKKLSKLKI
jgi:23S rRNA (guanosine2251-2'-O)-methyltransferase|tara:strand:- start:186 stop:353 length:168 start_codon:yes stop_codon:yes gene_type:complete